MHRRTSPAPERSSIRGASIPGSPPASRMVKPSRSALWRSLVKLAAAELSRPLTRSKSRISQRSGGPSRPRTGERIRSSRPLAVPKNRKPWSTRIRSSSSCTASSARCAGGRSTWLPTAPEMCAANGADLAVAEHKNHQTRPKSHHHRPDEVDQHGDREHQQQDGIVAERHAAPGPDQPVIQEVEADVEQDSHGHEPGDETQELARRRTARPNTRVRSQSRPAGPAPLGGRSRPSCSPR